MTYIQSVAMTIFYTTCGLETCNVCRGHQFGEPPMTTTELKICGVEATLPEELALIIMDAERLKRHMTKYPDHIECGRGKVRRGQEKVWPLKDKIKHLGGLVKEIVEYSSARHEPSSVGLFVSATAYVAKMAAEGVIEVILHTGELLRRLLVVNTIPSVVLEYRKSSLAESYFKTEDPTTRSEIASTALFWTEAKHLEEEIKRLNGVLALKIVHASLRATEGGHTYTIDERTHSVRLFHRVEEVLSLMKDVQLFKSHVDVVAKNAEEAFTALMKG